MLEILMQTVVSHALSQLVNNIPAVETPVNNALDALVNNIPQAKTIDGIKLKIY